MQCWRCGARVRPGAERCANCGAPLTDAEDYQEQEPGPGAGRAPGSSRGRGIGGGAPSAFVRPPLDAPDPFDDPRAPRVMRGGPPSGQGQPNSLPGDAGRARPSTPGGPGGPRNVPRSGQGQYPPPGRPPSRSLPPQEDYGYDDEPRDVRGGGGGGRGASRVPGGRDQRPPARDPRDSRDYGGRGGRPNQGYQDDYGDSAAWGESEGRLPAERDTWQPPFLGEDAEGRFHIPPARGGGKQASRKSTGRIVGVIVAVVLLIVVAVPGVLFGPQLFARLTGGGTADEPTPAPFATYTPGPTPTVAAHFKLYVSKTSGYAMSYPELWVPPSSESGTTGDYVESFLAAGSSSRLSVEQSSTFDKYSDDAIADGEVQGAEKTGAKLTPVADAPTTQAIGGESWLRREYTVSYDQQTLHMVILVCHHLGKGYVIVINTADKDYPTATLTYFTPMLQSFRFVAATATGTETTATATAK